MLAGVLVFQGDVEIQNCNSLILKMLKLIEDNLKCSGLNKACPWAATLHSPPSHSCKVT